ncbi:hypothetical protein ZHAS_00010994 [Anopheles sinensis]|uniref:Uncharacterized protein n=1 Tax=Anopheles sinensis TaxID=74873 RepID=A0A084VZ24_ANOSI|nr:hypothetical protein ZHAS_00010994 [Anopheles sinensis]
MTLPRALLFVLWLVSVGPEVRGHVGGGQLASSTRSTSPVRTVMDLMEVMLNRDILDMLTNGGYDFRQPARIFLPPKFYSSVPLDRGHMSPEEILSALVAPLQSKQLPPKGSASVASISSPSSLSQRSSTSAMGGKPIDHRQATAGDSDFGFAGKEQVVVLDGPDGSRINLISYSDGKVTSSSASGGSGPGVGKGRDALEKTVGSRAKPNQQRQPVTSSITDQTVSPNVARTLPTSERRSFAPNGRSSAGGSAGDGRGSFTDRLRSALPGEPDVDYPIFGSVPATTFSCDKRHHGK